MPRHVSDATQTVAEVTQPVTGPAAGAVQAVVTNVTDAAGTVVLGIALPAGPGAGD